MFTQSGSGSNLGGLISMPLPWVNSCFLWLTVVSKLWTHLWVSHAHVCATLLLIRDTQHSLKICFLLLFSKHSWYLKLFIYPAYMHICDVHTHTHRGGTMHATAGIWKSEDSVQYSVLSFSHVVRLHGKSLSHQAISWAISPPSTGFSWNY